MILWIRHVERRFHNSRAVAAIRVDRLLLKAMREIIAEGAVFLAYSLFALIRKIRRQSRIIANALRTTRSTFIDMSNFVNSVQTSDATWRD